MGSAIINKMIDSGIVKEVPNPQTQPQVRPLGLLFNPDGSYPTDKPLPQTQPQQVLKSEYKNGIPFGFAHSMSDFINNFMRNRFSQQTPDNQLGKGLESFLSRGQFSQQPEAFKPFGRMGQNDFIKNILASRGFASGGYVNTNLTTTIPPDRGPNPQGIQTLLERRYN